MNKQCSTEQNSCTQRKNRAEQSRIGQTGKPERSPEDPIRIAYITADWNRELVSIALGAVKAYLDEHSGICVHVFDCFTSALYQKKSSSRYLIYELPDLEQYDAVLVQAHEIEDNEVIARLGERIERAGIPGISVGVTMRGCVYIGTDDYQAAREVAEHLITAHNARSFLYLKGCERSGSGEAELRRHGFEDACRANGIGPEHIRYFSGEWESRRGKLAIEEWLARGRTLPDAVVSANDEMALGAMGALVDAGYHIPEDVMVAGYDGIFSATLSDPKLTTISRDFPTIIRTALENLVGRLRGEESPAVIHSPYLLLRAGTCGCTEDELGELPKIRGHYFSHSRRLERFYFMQDQLTAAMFGADPAGLLDAMESNYRIFGEGKLYIYANDSYFDSFADPDADDTMLSRSFSETFVLCACAGRSLECDEKHAYMRVTRSGLKDAPLIRDEKLVIFYPLQFEDINMGFMALTTPPTVSGMHLHESVINLYVFAMENARQRIRSKKLNSTLNALYMTDQLTGLYNRFGYDRIAADFMKGISRRGSKLHVLFLDIDDMKGINDRYGHEQGDLAIRAVTDVMNRSTRRSDFKMRFGGDEFVILSDSGDADLKGRLENNLRKINEDGTLPFRLDVSIGDYVAEEGLGMVTLDDLLRHADQLMYREKMKKKDPVMPEEPAGCPVRAAAPGGE